MPVALRPILPDAWVNDAKRCAQASLPEAAVLPRSKGEIALIGLDRPRAGGLRALVDLIKLRWCIERDDQDFEQELGLGHYEGRGWRGFHHHATLCVAAYGFLAAERGAFSPSAERRPALTEVSQLPQAYRPHGAPGSA